MWEEKVSWFELSTATLCEGSEPSQGCFAAPLVTHSRKTPNHPNWIEWCSLLGVKYWTNESNSRLTVFSTTKATKSTKEAVCVFKPECKSWYQGSDRFFSKLFKKPFWFRLVRLRSFSLGMGILKSTKTHLSGLPKPNHHRWDGNWLLPVLIPRSINPILQQSLHSNRWIGTFIKSSFAIMMFRNVSICFFAVVACRVRA